MKTFLYIEKSEAFCLGLFDSMLEIWKDSAKASDQG